LPSAGPDASPPPEWAPGPWRDRGARGAIPRPGALLLDRSADAPQSCVQGLREARAIFNPTSIIAKEFGAYLAQLYLDHFGGRNAEYAAFLNGAARLVLERIGNSDALYHNAEHTMMVTLVGQQIIRGRLLCEALRPEDWIHYTVALLCHDVGYVRGACPGDDARSVVIDAEGNRATPPKGASDAWLAPWHVERGMIYARRRFAKSSYIDEERIAAAIACTRFPVPADASHEPTDSEPALVRAADLIGQMADPYYHRKIAALYHEFVETGIAAELGYTTPFDLVDRYPEFFWKNVEPLIPDALRFLELTIEGKQWVANLYNNIFQSEHQKSFIGPFPGPPA
jgi:hypothetical protein